jgi:hypothetical protein
MPFYAVPGMGDDSGAACRPPMPGQAQSRLAFPTRRIRPIVRAVSGSAKIAPVIATVVSEVSDGYERTILLEYRSLRLQSRGVIRRAQ